MRASWIAPDIGKPACLWTTMKSDYEDLLRSAQALGSILPLDDKAERAEESKVDRHGQLENGLPADDEEETTLKANWIAPGFGIWLARGRRRGGGY